MSQNKIKRIGLFGHYANTNLGDEAIIAAAIQSTRKIRPDIELFGFSLNPEGTKERHGIESFPIRRNYVKQSKEDLSRKEVRSDQAQISGARNLLKKIPLLPLAVKALRKTVQFLKNSVSEIRFFFKASKYLNRVDMLIFAGSGQIFDGFGGPFGFPYTLCKWTFLCRLKGKKIVFLSVGAGPINSKISRFFLFKSLKRADYYSFRDNYSNRLLKSKGFKKEGPVYPDLAVCLDFKLDDYKKPENRKIAAIDPIPYANPNMWMFSDESVYQDYLKKTIETTSGLVDLGYDVIFIPNNILVDNIVIDQIYDKINKEFNKIDMSRISRAEIDSIESLLNCFNRCDLIIASRFHGILMSLLVPKPVIGLSYHPKTEDMMEYMGVGDFVLSIDHFKVDEIMTLVKKIEIDYDSLIDKISTMKSKNRNALESQYASLLKEN